MRRARSSRGFSLVELVVVMALVATLTGLAAVSLGGRSEESLLRRDAALVASLAGEARLRAIGDGGGADLLLRPEDGAPAIAGAAGRAQPLRQGVSAAIFGADRAPVERISFYPGGGSSGGLIALKGGSTEIAVAIDWLTGEARVLSPKAVPNAAR